MRSWTYYIQLVGRDKKGVSENESALYIVAVPMNNDIFKEVLINCYASHYLPEDNAIKYGFAYALGVDFEIQDLDKYGLQFLREEDELYIFKENINMKEGLINVYRILMDRLTEKGYNADFDIYTDVGSPSEELMRECLLKAMRSGY